MDSAEITELKGKRSSAQAAFTRRANKISLTATIMEKGAIIDEMRALSADFNRMHDTALAFLEAVEDVEGSEEEARKTKTKVEQCVSVYGDTMQLTRDILYNKFAKSEIQLHIEGTEETCKEVENANIAEMLEHEFEALRDGLLEGIHELEQKVLTWERLVSDKVTHHKQTIFKLKSRARDWELNWKKLSRMPKLEPAAARIQQTVDQPNVLVASPSPSMQTISKPQISLERTRLPIFSGDMTDYYRWKAEWAELEQLGNPMRTAGVTRFHLLASLSERVKKDLVLSSCSSPEEMFKRLDNHFGNKARIVLKIAEDIESLPPVKGNNPRKAIELIQAVERALSNLVILGEEDILKNRLVAQSLERKLPNSLKEKWIEYKAEPLHGFTPQTHFDCLLLYLQKQEAVLEELDQLDESLREGTPQAKSYVDKSAKKAFSKATSGQKGYQPQTCTACSDTCHAGRLFACTAFRGMDLPSKKSHLNANKLCSLCLGPHSQPVCGNKKIICTKADCRAEEPHHYLLCSRSVPLESTRKKSNGKGLGLTSHQEELLEEVTPELREEFRKAFSNKTTSAITCSAGKAPLEYPVVMMLLEVTTNSGQLIGTLLDLASDTNYITHCAAQRLGLSGESIRLIVHGVGGMTKTVKTNRYSLRLRVKTAKGTVAEHKLLCYGLESIAEVSHPVTPAQLQKIFPGVAAEDLARPETIDLLISHREGRLVPQPLKREGDLVLWDGPLGKTVGGTHPDLFESVDLTFYQSETHFARTMRTSSRLYQEILAPTEELPPTAFSNTAVTNKEVFEWFKWDSIGAACSPKCGSCKCGKCSPGGQEMTLGEERELEKIKGCLSYVLADKHSDTPHWDAAYPWKVNPASLPNNRQAVKATFRNTEARLAKEPLWKAAYGEQINDMVARGATVKLTREQIKAWNGPVWYISHLVAPNPHSSSTPVRIVWNSSQEFKGMSLNNLLHKGPDVLNPIRGVLLRFRSGLYVALGDVRKMYNSVWLKDQEVHLHRFLWRDDPKEEIADFAVVRVNIGDKPAGCIAQVAMRETANLPQFESMIPERHILTEDCYVDDILTSHNDFKVLTKMTEGVEEILKAGGFSLKPWVLTGQSGRGEEPDCPRATEPKTLVLPNQMRDEESKALGLGYEPDSDKLRLLASVNFSKRRGKMRTGLDLQEDEVRANTPDPLTRRVLLSQVAGFYDPIGLASPIKQRGVMLVRESFQEAGKDRPVKDTWDDPLSPHLRETAISLFEQCVRLGKVRFHRSLTPPGAIGRPMGITFSDGSEASYGAVLYLRWETAD